MSNEEGPVHNLFQSVASLLATFLAVAQTRLELLTTEMQTEVHRAAEIVVLMLVVLFAAGIGLFMTALVVIFVLWDTHRLLASVVVTCIFFVIALLAAYVLRVKLKTKPPMLEATLAELAKDRRQLAARRQREIVE
jgi:uncharacterized membrane protein YqjE